jgi:hypothetical protein
MAPLLTVRAGSARSLLERGAAHSAFHRSFGIRRRRS